MCEAGEGEAETTTTAHCGTGGGLISTDLLVCGFENYCVKIWLLFWHEGGGGMNEGAQKYWRVGYPFGGCAEMSIHPPTAQKAWVWGWVLSRRPSLGSGRRSPVSHSLAPFQPLLLLTGARRMTPRAPWGAPESGSFVEDFKGKEGGLQAQRGRPHAALTPKLICTGLGKLVSMTPWHPAPRPIVRSPGMQAVPVGPLDVMGGGVCWSKPHRLRASAAVTPYLLDSSSPTIAGSAQYFILVAPARAAEPQACLINGLKGLSSFAEASVGASVSSTEIIFPSFLQGCLSSRDASPPVCRFSLTLSPCPSLVHTHTHTHSIQRCMYPHTHKLTCTQVSISIQGARERTFPTDKKAHTPATRVGTRPHRHQGRATEIPRLPFLSPSGL